jgi:hypothetical protein
MGRYSLVYHFRFCSCLFTFVKDIFFCLQENLLWNWSLSSEIQNCSFLNTHLVYQLYIFCNICWICFFLTFTPMISINAITCRLYDVTLIFEAVWSTVGNCEAEYFLPTRSITLLQFNEIKNPKDAKDLFVNFFSHLSPWHLLGFLSHCTATML